MKYAVRHLTTYSYDDDVSDSLGIAHLTPRSLPWQQVDDVRIKLSPEPGDIEADEDYYGNLVTYFQVTEPHETLEIDASSLVDVQPRLLDEAAAGQPWEHYRPLVDPTADGAWRATDFALASASVELVPAAAAYAGTSLSAGRPIGEAVKDLMRRIHTDFDYDSTATTVTSTVGDILSKRAGVCQDFAHLTLAALRAHGLAARYVSGYLATDPPPGKTRIVGADASHAWVEVWIGADQWLPIDPTNDQVVNDRYVTVAWGRDYADVPPVKGVIFTDAKKSTMKVSVDVAPVS